MNRNKDCFFLIVCGGNVYVWRLNLRYLLYWRYLILFYVSYEW